MKIFDMDLQEILIGLALIIILPTTVYFGCRIFVLQPGFDSEYFKKERKFMSVVSKGRPKIQEENYTAKREEWQKKYDARKHEWQQTPEFAEWQQKICPKDFYDLAIKGSVSTVCFVIGAYVAMSAIAASMVMTGLILWLMYNHSYSSCVELYGLSLFWLEFMFVLFSILVVLYASYRDSE